MADNVTIITPDGPVVIAALDDGTAKHQRVKVEHGADNQAVSAAAATPFPIYDAAGTLATQATIAAVLAKLSADPATQATLAALLTKLGASPAQEHSNAGSPASARLSDGTSYLASTAGRLQVSDGGVSLSVAEASAAAILAKLSSDPATQTTLAAINTKLSNTLAVSFVDISKGDAQAASTSVSALLSSLVTIPSGATKVDLRPTAEIRVRDNGSNPTATLGMRVLPDEYWTYRGSLLSQLRVINAATIECWFYA